MLYPPGLRALNHRDFRLFFLGQLISLIGTWMQTVGQSWLILELTDSPFKLGLISTLQFLPVMLFALAAGAVVDRLPKRRLIVFTQISFMLLAFILSALVYLGVVQYWHVAVLATLLGIFNALDMPARQAFIVEMVGKPDLMNAIALNSAMFNGARVVGPAVAGLLIARFGVGLAFLLNGISYLAVILALVLIGAEGLPGPRQGTRIHQEIREGLAYAWRTPVVALALAMLLTLSVFVINYNVIVPLLAKSVLHAGAEGFGLLMAALGLGAMVGALSLAALGRERPTMALLFGFALTLTGAYFTTGLLRSFALAAAALFVVGGTQILFTASCNTVLQVTAPDQLRGRVMSLYTLVFAGVTPIGAFLTGSVTEAFGVPAGFLIGGGLGLLCILALLLWQLLRRHAAPAAAGPRP